MNAYLHQLVTKSQKTYKLPLFLPVYQPKSNLISIEDLKNKFSIDGLIVNGFFLYKDAEIKKQFEPGLTLHDYIGFDGLIMTDSGAFQGLKRPLYLSNKKIVKFQDAIKADIVSPLDLISPPGDNYKTAEKKLISTSKRIREAKEIVVNGILAGVQQGGRFLDLRRKGMEDLMEIGVEYIAIGSLVPFFNKNHNLSTIIKILRDARAIAGDDLPMHVYGAGDPVELPFLAALGADIFDSSSYGHYAISGWYMTLYGALKKDEKDKILEYGCCCDVCKELKEVLDIFTDPGRLAAHNLFVIIDTLHRIREAMRKNELGQLLDVILKKHKKWFENSLLNKSWDQHAAGPVCTALGVSSATNSISNTRGTMLMEEVISIIASKAIKKYKIDYETAVDIAVEVIEKHPKFLQLLEKELPLKEILKTRVYDEVDKKARRRIYYALRQYNKNIELQESLIASLKQIPSHSSPTEYRGIIEKLVQSHISTKERLNSLDFFYHELFKYMGEPASIVDVGCGMHPLLFPFEEAGKSVERYVALDKDTTSISALEAFSGIPGKNILHSINWNIKDGWDMVLEKGGIQRFDVAFLMKLVPVVSRLERSLLGILLETPARTWVITGSKTSMTKHMDIERRERRIIKQFIDRSAKEVTGEFSTAEEFCIIAK